MSHANGFVLRKSLLVVGPKRSSVTRKELAELRSTITSTPDLAFLAKAITELESLWPTISGAHPELRSIRGEESLSSLCQLFQGGELLNLTQTEARHNHILLDLITVLSHIVSFWRLASTKIENSLFASQSVNLDPSSYLQDIQGFCLGFLTAAAVSSSRDKVEFQANTATVLRIAVCIGALVESDAVKLESSEGQAGHLSVGWNSQAEYEKFNNILDVYPNGYIACMTDKGRATVTIGGRDVSILKQKLSASGLSVQSLNLEGRYHCRAAYEDGVRQLKVLFRQDPRFQLPSAADLILPLRSNINGELISEGTLHDIALESILLEQCQWYETVYQAATHSHIQTDDIVRVGAETAVPRSMTNASWQPNSITNGCLHAEDSALDAASAVAVIGMACRYPDADSLEELWELLSTGKSAVQPLPADRFKMSEATREPKGAFWGNFLRHPDHYDHRFFGISGREAKYMDPQQRLVLQVAYEVLESAGYFGVKSSPENFPADIGCYLGVGSVDYGDNIASHDATAFSALGTLPCSSGAVAIHAAVNAIKSNECSLALAGGVNVITSPALFQNLAAASFLSPTGASKAFDASANGYCRGEGAGLVLLKSLARARADGDSILAIITGSAVNQGANRTPITVPDSSSQSTLYKKALSLSGTHPKEVSYVEAHGTGTTVGDPIECESIRQTFGGSDRAHKLFFGSVKDNIGHTEAASGAAALIKTILMMQKRTIPKQANFVRLNPKIAPLEPDHMAVPQRTQPWTAPRRIAVINNYGAAGSNAAIVVWGPHVVPATSTGHRPSTAGSELPFFISAKTPESLREYCTALKASLPKIQKSHGSAAALQSLAYNLSVKQNRGFDYKYSFTASTLEEFASNLDRAWSIELKKLPVSANQRPVVLCIGGQSGRTVHLDEELFRTSKLLQKHLDDCEQACQALDLPSLYPTIFSPELVEDLVCLHCLLFAVQYASAKSWLDCGATVDTIVGHSFGQLTALVVAGVLSLSDGLRFIAERARLIQLFWGQETGAMLSVQGDNGTVSRLLERTKSHYPSLATEVACYNGPQTIVLAGERASIDAVEEMANVDDFSRRLEVVRLKNTHAFHSSLVDSILPGLRKVAATLDFQQPSIRIEACSKDQDWNQVIDAETVVQHSRMPVYFYEAVQRIAARLGPCVFLEAGSASPIVPMARRALTVTDEAKSEYIFQPIDIGSPNSLRKFARATSNMWAAGLKVQYWPFHHSQKDSFAWVNLPPYQFQKTSHWIEYVAAKSALPEPAQAMAKDREKPLELLELYERNPQGLATFIVNQSHEMFKHCTEGHAVLGESLCPASMYVEMVIRAVDLLSLSQVSPLAPCVKNLKISSPLSVCSTRNIFLQLAPVSREQQTWEFTILSRSQLSATASIKHAAGTVSMMVSGEDLDAPRMQFIQRLIGHGKYEELANSRGSHALHGNIVYQVFSQIVDYSPYYRGVSQIVSKNNEAAGIVNVPGNQLSVINEAICDPITLDNFLQVAGIHVNCLSERNAEEVFVCTEVGELFLSDNFLAKRREIRRYEVYSSFDRSAGKTLVNDIFVFDLESGDLMVLFLGAIFQGVPIKSLARTLAKLNGAVSSTDIQPNPIIVSQEPTKINLNPMALMAEVQTATKTNGVAVTTNNIHTTPVDMLPPVIELLSRVIEISPEEIQPSTSLTDLGIDSLMSTEILNEINNQFDIVIPIEQFLSLGDVQSLAQLLSPDTTPASIPQRQLQQEQEQHATTPIQTSGPNGLATSFGQIQKFLSSLLGVSADEIAADTPLTDLGIDSLMATELLSEIKKRFGVTILAQEFQEFQNVLAIASRLHASSSLSSGILTPPLSLGHHANGQLDGHTNGVTEGVNIESMTPFASLAHDSFLSVRSDFDPVSQDLEFADFYAAVYPAQMQLVVTYIVEAFKDMGCSLAALQPGETILNVPVISKHHKVKTRIYQILEDANIIERDAAGNFARTATPVPCIPSGQLHQAIVANFPQHAFEHNLLASTGAKLADCLTGRTDPLAILFGSAKARTLMENVYTHAPMFKTGTINLARYLVKVFESFHESRPIRILELGAGTGGTTKHLVECLAATQKDFQYTFTDISCSLVATARKKFAQYNFMRYTVLDIEKDPDAQSLGQYDIVIATNCIHATKDLTQSCTNINKRLRPDGVLCLVELTRNLFWFDLVFGLLEGWWLFEDGRQSALANETLWRKHLSRSGFRWIDWTVGASEESNVLRVITASPSDIIQPLTTETVTFKRAGDVSLEADIYYPEQEQIRGNEVRPVALMIHGGGHVMLSRKDIRPAQTRMLLAAGFLPVSIDYRLCPETTLPDGPMQDVCDALAWARAILPGLLLRRRDVRADGGRVVAVGWSTGGHLALTLGFTAAARGVRAPDATLAFYCPSDYEDPFWTRPNFPFGQDISGDVARLRYDLSEGIYDHPITAYNPPVAQRALGGWMSPSDPRSRIALHMNWTGRYLRVLLNGLDSCRSGGASGHADGADPTDALPDPSPEQIQAVSPLAQIRRGMYNVPTFIVHGTKDDLIPWQQALRTYEALRQQDVEAEIRILDGAVHLFDLYRSYEADERANEVLREGYEFLSRHIV
ncbi:hypothetical protein DL768_009434 [Monosporascus sp. mg162]|nr:hypothetical protein DL768_009434 [Monosporascus sp. mg162]